VAEARVLTREGDASAPEVLALRGAALYGSGNMGLATRCYEEARPPRPGPPGGSGRLRCLLAGIHSWHNAAIAAGKHDMVRRQGRMGLAARCYEEARRRAGAARGQRAPCTAWQQRVPCLARPAGICTPLVSGALMRAPDLWAAGHSWHSAASDAGKHDMVR